MFEITIENSWEDVDGRVVLINAYFKTFKFSLCNIYAPNNAALQKVFIENLAEILISKADISNLIVVGDWNVTLEAVDKKGGIQWKPSVYRDLLVQFMDELNLVDILRIKNPGKKCFTYESSALKMKSRIDFFLIPKSLIASTKTADIKTAIAPDHKAIRLNLQCEIKKRGPGLWKFNNSLLNDDTFVDLITTNYPLICSKYAYLANLNLKWEMIKMEIRSLTIPYAKNKAKKVRNLEKQLESSIESLENKINTHPDNDTDAEQQEYERLKNELRRIYEERADGAIFRSKIRWIEHGEKPTKYFFNMERRNYNKKTITELTVAGGTTISKEDDILVEIRSFYENLYNTDLGDDSTSLFQDFTDTLKTKLPKLSEDQRDVIEGKLTLEECRKALMSLRCGKSPGEDGFTVEFYKFFFELLGREFLDSINASYDQNELSISQRRGVITLIPKEDANLKDLSNWRPITLLNVDYKIASKAIATRIEKVLPLLINSNQTGFVKGRYIGENIRVINDILEQTKAQDIPGILLLLDFRKAFDTLEWGFIQNTLDLFNFGSNIKQWVKTFYNNTESSVLHNGFTTNYFKLSRGVRQGCPLSPYLFILGAEILAARVRLERNIEGITIFKTEHKISQFADDTSLFLKNIDSITNAIEILRLFGNISGLKLNLGKTKAIWLGSWRHKENKPLGLNWTKEPVRALGIFISYNEQENDKKNVAKKIDNLNIKLDIWRGRKLSLFGKCLIVKTLGISQIVYSTSMLDISPNDTSRIKKSIFSFIWNKKPDKIKRNIMCQDYANEGLRAPDPDVLFKSLRLSWISRLLIPDETTIEPWKAIPSHFFKKYGGLNFLLRCNYDYKFLEKSGIPAFYRQILANFLELRNLYQHDNGQDLILFNNKDILIDGKSFFLQKWKENGVTSIQDILDNDGKLLTFQSFQDKFKIKSNFLNYLQVISAIPKHLLYKAKSLHRQESPIADATTFSMTPSQIIDLYKMKCKDYYWLYINGTCCIATGPRKWEKDLKTGNIDWKTKFKNIGKICCENRLREFNFKLLHRLTVTQKELRIYGVNNENSCPYCKEPDSILHTFVECHYTQTFYAKVVDWFNAKFNSSFSPTSQEKLFGTDLTTSRNNELKLNYCLLFAKYYLYYQKLYHKDCNITEFVLKLEQKLLIESCLKRNILV